MAHDQEPGDAGADRRESIVAAAPATAAIIALNVAVYLVMVARGQNGIAADARALVAAGGNFEPLVAAGQWWRLLTGAFLHGGLLHIGLNMVALWSGGPLLEESVGTRRYLPLYFLAAIGAALSSLFVGPAAVSVGASGAVFGVYGALLGLALRHTPPGERWRSLVDLGRDRRRVQTEADTPEHPAATEEAHGDVFLTPHLARRLASQIVGLFVFNLLVGLTIPGIDNAAHVGGFACGIALGWVSAARPSRRGTLVPLLAGTIAVLLAGSAGWPWLPAPVRIQACDVACRWGAGAGCLAAGLELERGGAPGRKAALTYFERGCAAGSRDACVRLGRALLASGAAGQRAAVMPLTSACTGGDAGSCAALAALFESGLGVSRDPSRAAHWWAQACERNDASSCLRLGGAYRTGRGVKEDAAKAAAAFSRACDAGAAAGCALYAAALADGAGVARDTERAASLYARACQGGHASACGRAGMLIEHTGDADRDAGRATRAAALYERGCALRDAVSCFNLGALHDAGRGREKDAARARALYRQACALGMRQVCGLLALWDAMEADNDNRKVRNEN